MIIFGPMYGIVNFVLHWIIDFFSSKAATKLWKMEARHWFFVVIGIDQALHYTCLLLTIPLMGWGWGL
jgi:hypothetical protein